jgi:polyisoprenoid-binding protein YceI
MKKSSFYMLIMVALTMGACQSNSEKATEGTSDKVEGSKTEEVVENRAFWSCQMLGMYSHSGFANVSHNLTFGEKGEPIGGTITVDLTTITPTDNNYDAEKNQTPGKLVEHLSSADFFDVKQFPYATFEISSINLKERVANGEMTIKGITRPETIRVVIDPEANVYKGKLHIDRTKYGITWSHPVKEMVLSDKFDISVQFKR